jgi:hypothetical protein
MRENLARRAAAGSGAYISESFWRIPERFLGAVRERRQCVAEKAALC